MPVELICHQCGTRLRLQEDIGGDRLTCHRCQTPVLAPTADSDEQDLTFLKSRPEKEWSGDEGRGAAIVLAIVLPLTAALLVYLVASWLAG